MNNRINVNINAVNLTTGTGTSSSINTSTNNITAIKPNYNRHNDIEEIYFEDTNANNSIDNIDIISRVNNYLETARLINTRHIETLTNERDRLQEMYEQFLTPAKEETEKYKFAVSLLANPDIPYNYQPTDEMRLLPIYEKYIQDHLEEFEDFMGMTLEEYNLRIEELNSGITYLEAYDYTLRQEAKKIPYLEIEVSADYQNYLSNLTSETQEVKIPREYLNSINYQTIDGYTFRTNYYVKYDRAISNFAYLNHDQINMYNYLFETKGETAALDYLLAIEDSINQVKGYAEATKFLQKIVNEDGSYDLNASTFFDTTGKGLETGVETFFEGFENLMDFTGDGIKTDNQYAQMFILQELQKSGELDDEFLSGTFEVSTSIGNMLPASAISLTLNIIAPGSGEIVGNTLMGLSAAGNAKNEALISGSNKTQAYIYGLLTGTSEAVLGELLGNIPGLNTGAKFALLDILKEGGEELVQEYIDAGLRATILGESIDISELDAQALKSFFYGCLSSGVMTGGQATISFTYNGAKYVINNSEELINFYNNRQTNIDSGNETNTMNNVHQIQLNESDFSDSSTLNVQNADDTKYVDRNFCLGFSEDGVLLDSDGNSIGVSSNNQLLRNILSKFNGEFDFKTRATSCKYIFLDDGNSYVLLGGGPKKIGINNMAAILAYRERMKNMDMLADAGVNVPRLIGRFEYNDSGYEVQEAARGEVLFRDTTINFHKKTLGYFKELKQLFEFDNNFYFKFVSDIDKICAAGFDIDTHLENFLLDVENEQINFIDLNVKRGTFSKTNEKLISFFNRLNRVFWDSYNHYTQYGLEKYLPPIEDVSSMIGNIKVKLVDSYANLLLSQNYSNEDISVAVDSFRTNLDRNQASLWAGVYFPEKLINMLKKNEETVISFKMDDLLSDIELLAQELVDPTVSDIQQLIGECDFQISGDKVPNIDYSASDFVIEFFDGCLEIKFSEEFLKRVNDTINQSIITNYNVEANKLLEEILSENSLTK